MIRKLSEIRQGQQVLITDFEKDDIFLKLMEMGCVPGELITIEKIAPLGDPISVTIAGYTLSLRLDEAKMILVDDNI